MMSIMLIEEEVWELYDRMFDSEGEIIIIKGE